MDIENIPGSTAFPSFMEFRFTFHLFYAMYKIFWTHMELIRLCTLYYLYTHTNSSL